MTTADAAAALAAIVGERFVAPPGGPDHVDGVPPRWVVRPGGQAEAADVVRACAERGLAVVPCGLGRHLDMGGVPSRCDVLLRLDRLDAIVAHEPGDMTATVAAGCRLDVLQQALARHGQWLPLDPPAPEATTIGGLVAANLSGPLRASQGTVRDLLLGVEVVDASGALVRGGGRVVKNVAGYDLPKLHVGALGSLGVLVAATFKLRPRPPLERALVIACPGAEDACDLALAVRDELDAAWLEVCAPPPADLVAPGPGAPALLAVGLAGIPAEVEDGARRVERVAGVRRRASRPVDDGAGLRAGLGGFALGPAAGVLRISTLPTELGPTLSALQDAARSERATVAAGAHVASGVARAAVREPAAVAALVRRLRPRIAAAGGHLVVERASADVKRTLTGDADAWGDPGPGAALARGIKAALDPSSLLSPGRLPGGL